MHLEAVLGILILRLVQNMARHRIPSAFFPSSILLAVDMLTPCAIDAVIPLAAPPRLSE